MRQVIRLEFRVGNIHWTEREVDKSIQGNGSSGGMC